MKPGQIIFVSLIDLSGTPLQMSGIYVDVELYTHGNYRYGFRMGATNEQGELKIDYAMVEAKRAESAAVFLMDYNTPLEACDERVKISIPSEQILKKAYDGIGAWFGGVTPEYAKGWLTANNSKVKADEIFVELNAGETIVPMLCDRVGS